MRKLLLSLSLIALCPGWLVAQQLAVVSRADDIVVFHQLPSGEEVGRARVGPNSHEMVVDYSGAIAYVVSYSEGAIYAVDLETFASRVVREGSGEQIHSLVLSKDGQRLWVTAEEQQRVLEVALRSGDITRSWPTQGEMSHMVEVAADEQKLYTANMSSASISVIDFASEATRVIPTGAGTEGIDLLPDGSELWVSNRADATVSVIDTETETVVATFPSHGDFPVKLRVRPDGREVWVVNNQSQTVTVFDTDTRQLVATIEVGARPLGIIFSQDGGRAFVTRPGVPEVVVIDTATRDIVHRFPTGASADGMVWIP